MVFERFEAFKLRCTIHLVIYPLRNSPTDSGDEAKLMLCAEKKWRTFNGVEKLSDVVQQVKFVDAIRKAA